MLIASEILFFLNLIIVIALILVSLVMNSEFKGSIINGFMVILLIEILSRFLISTRLLLRGSSESNLIYHIEAILGLFLIEVMFLFHASIYLINASRANRFLNNNEKLKRFKHEVIDKCLSGIRIYFIDLINKYPIYRELLISMLLEIASDMDLRLLLDSKSCIAKIEKY